MKKYQSFENDELWGILDKALNDLEQNQDIKITTEKRYVIGYLIQEIKNSK